MIPTYYQPNKGVQIICAPLCECSSVCSRSGEKFQTFWPRGAATSVGLVGILITENSDGVRTSSKLMCACGVLSRPHGKKLVKFGTCFGARTFQTRCRGLGATYAKGWLIMVGASRTSPVPGSGMRRRHARRRILPSFRALLGDNTPTAALRGLRMITKA